MKREIWREILFAVLMASSFLPVHGLSAQALNDLTAPEALLTARFPGQAFEDIFGFGFWFTWSLFLIVEVLFLVGAWLAQTRSSIRYLVLIPVGAFIAASVFSYAGHQRVYELYVKVIAA